MTFIEDDRPLAEDRWVRIMCDYSADGVWDRQGRCCLAEELPVPDELIERIRRWQAWYELSDIDGGFDPGFDLVAFADEGFAIGRAVKAALPDWTVIYWDEARWHRADKARFTADWIYRGDPPTSEYEYEVLSIE